MPEDRAGLLARCRAYAAQLRLLAAALQPFSRDRRRRARRQLAWEVLRREGEAVTFERDGLRWHGDVSDTVAEGLFVDGRFHLEALDGLLAWLARRRPETLTRPLVVNVGANIGAAALPLVRRAGKRCLACEPVPETFTQLRHNVALNGLEAMVECRQVAIAAAVGHLDMVATGDSGQSEVRGADGRQGFAQHPRLGGTRAVTVPCLPLDSLIAEAGHSPGDVALVWSDTQGFESEVIASGASLWAAGVPLWVEVWPDGLEAHGGVGRFLEVCSLSFRSFVLDESLVKRGAKAEPRPVAELAEVVASLWTGNRRHRQLETDVLLLPT
jgi:FkbM family methyltransferase